MSQADNLKKSPRSGRRGDPVAPAAICLLLALLSATFGTDTTASQPEDDASLRALVAKYFEAAAANDVDRAIACWSANSPQRAAKLKELGERSTRTSQAAAIVNIRQLETGGVKTSLRVEVEVGADPGDATSTASKLSLDFEFVREGSRWTIWAEEPAQTKLAARLAAVETVEERATLLTAENGLKSPSLCKALVWRGNRLRELGEYPRAREIFDLALTLAREIGDKDAEGQALRDLGYLFRLQDELDKAMECFRKSLSIRTERRDRSGTASLLREIGVVHYLERDYPEAMECYGQSLKLYRDLADKPEVSQTLYNTGVLYRALGEFDQALGYYEQSLRIRQELGNKAGEAACYYSMANILSDRGSYSKALGYYQKSLEVNKALNNQLSVATVLNGMANVYLDQGRPERSLALFQDSIAICRSIGGKRLLAAVLNNMAIARLALDDHASAQEGCEQSLALYEELKDKDGIAREFLTLGLMHRLRNDPRKAVESLEKSLSLAESMGDKGLISSVLSWMAGAQGALANFDQAVESAMRSAEISRVIGARTTLSRACTALGQAYRELHQPDKARKAFEEAIRVTEDLRYEVAGDESDRVGFFTSMVSPYHGMVEMEAEQSNVKSALLYAERAKGRVLLDALQNSREDIDSRLDSGEREEERRRTAAIGSLNNRLSLAAQSRNPDQTRITRLKADLDKARLEREAFETNVYAAHPELQVRRGELPMPSAADAARLLPGPTGAFLEFVVNESRTYLFFVARNGTDEAAGATVHAYAVPIAREELQRKVEHLRKQIADRDLEFHASAVEMYDQLLGPARSDLKGRNSLVIVPDGPLWDLPFQALVSGGKYMWEQYEISYAPSLAVLRETVRLHERRASGKNALPKLLAMGDSSPPRANGTGTGTRAVGYDKSPPEVEDQVKQIGSMYGKRARVYLGAYATEERFKREAGSYGIIHLSTHGMLVDANPMYSHLVMAHGTGEDGELEAREIMRLHLNADLVVLAACETARGRADAGEGVIGLSWALFVAGCPTVVVSQWKVDATATTAIMVEFHRLLQPGLRLSKAAALRQASLRAMHNPRYRHPYYWAGFTLVGDSF